MLYMIRWDLIHTSVYYWSYQGLCACRLTTTILSCGMEALRVPHQGMLYQAFRLVPSRQDSGDLGREASIARTESLWQVTASEVASQVPQCRASTGYFAERADRAAVNDLQGRQHRWTDLCELLYFMLLYGRFQPTTVDMLDTKWCFRNFLRIVQRYVSPSLYGLAGL